MMSAIDTVEFVETNAVAPARNAVEITPSDAGDLAYVTRALYIGSGGTLTVQMQAGQVVTFIVLAGQVLPVRVRRVLATGTTAADIVALW